LRDAAESAAVGIPAINQAVVIDVVTAQPVVVIEAVIVIKPATVSPPEAAVHGVLVKPF
jgi:hypothetical protein